MKALISSFIFFFSSLNALGFEMQISLESYGWDYVYLNSNIKNLHIIKNKKNDSQRAFIQRKISVLKSDEELFTEKFLKRNCDKIPKKIKRKIIASKNLCIQNLSIGGKESTTYSFATQRGTSKSRSYIWSTVNFVDTNKYKVDLKVFNKLRRDLEKNLL